jgi:acetylornithine deacetylase/succinyl-diaminopimelate desuccinylase-like protein
MNLILRKFILIILLLLFTFEVRAQPQPLPTLKLIQELVRIDTTNPPGNETRAAQFVQNYLGKFGIPSQIIESAPTRGNLIARLKAEGNKKPLMLLAHLDVVPADPAEWSHPPFEATVADGYLYGRGVMDMKGQAALMINTFIQLKLQQIPLAGDVLLVLVADEENGGKLGAEFLLKQHWPEIESGLVINEGSIALKRGELHLYPIQVAEKGVAWLKLTATGSSGHGAMPIENNATLKLIHALNKISERPEPIQKTAIVEEMLDRLAEHFSFPMSFLLRHFFDFPIRQLLPLFAGSKIQSDRIFNALLRDTVVPTVLQAGSKTNVIPAEAVAEVDGRILPGEKPEDFLEKINNRINDPAIRIDWIHKSEATDSDFHTPEFAALEAAIREADPEAIVFPFISPGGTDMRFFRENGILAYGIIPFMIEMEDIAGLHGKNERIPVAEIPKGEKILMEFVKKIQAR